MMLVLPAVKRTTRNAENIPIILILLSNEELNSNKAKTNVAYKANGPG